MTASAREGGPTVLVVDDEADAARFADDFDETFRHR
jgi:hypothetical protein